MNQVFDEPLRTITLQMTCPRCGKAMQKEMTLPLSMARVMQNVTDVLCDQCGDVINAERAKRAEEEAKAEMLDNAGIPKEFRAWDETKGNFQACKWVTENKNSNLLLIGEVNTGKTRAMTKVLMDECLASKKVLFIDFCEFAESYAGAMQESIRSAANYMNGVVCRDYDVIMFDDIDKRKINETAGNLLYKLFNKLYSGDIHARLWFTMNHNGREFLQMFENRDYGAAVISRIDRMMKDGRFYVHKIADKTS